MKNSNKMIVMDLDGTLLRNDKTISEYTINTLKKLRENGHKIVIATARPYRAAKIFLKKLQIDAGIYHNGALIYKDGVKIDSFQIDDCLNVVKDILAFNNKVSVAVESNDVLYSNFDVEHLWKGTDYILTKDNFIELQNKKADKIIIEVDSYEDMQRYEKILSDDLYIQMSENVIGMIMKKTATKSNGIDFLSKSYNIAKENIIGFGDDYNDIDMLNFCGVSVCVENAIPKVKEIADNVCESNENDGVARWLADNINENPIPFWEETYKDDNIATFSVMPNATLKEYEHLLNYKSNILEVGCGEGQNVLYLSKKGYKNIDAFDLSNNAIKKLEKRCALENLHLNSFIADLTNYNFEKNYDLIMSFGTLHFVNKNDWKSFILKAKENTNIGGIHIMQIFVDLVPPSKDIAPFVVGLAKDEEIKELYKDWEILQFKSYVFEDEHPNVPKHMHASNKIVARKKG